MTEATLQPIDWDAVRLRYEGLEETVVDIARSIGMHQPDLSRHARERGWRLRRARRRSMTTVGALRRLKLGLQERLSKFDEGTKAIRKGTKAATADARLTNTLLVNFEKVLELEKRHGRPTSAKSHQRGALHDAERHELARRIAALLTSGESRPCQP